MVAYVFVVAVLNLGLGFAVAVHLARRHRDLMSATLPARPDSATARAIIRPATAEDVARAMESLVEVDPGDIAAERSEAEPQTEEPARHPASEAANNTNADAVETEPNEQDNHESQQEVQGNQHDIIEGEEESKANEPAVQAEEPDYQPHGDVEPTQTADDVDDMNETESDWNLPADADEVDADEEACSLFRKLHEAQRASLEALDECQGDADEEVEMTEDVDQATDCIDESLFADRGNEVACAESTHGDSPLSAEASDSRLDQPASEDY